MSHNDDGKTPTETPYAKAVADIVRRQLVELKFDLAEIIRQVLRDEMGAWRAEVDAQRAEHEAAIRDHDARIRHLERVIEASRADTEPPPEGLQ